MIDEAAPGGGGHVLGAKPDESPGRDGVIEAHPTLSIGRQIGKFPLAGAEHFHDASLMGILDVHGELLPGLAYVAVDSLHDDAGAAYRELIAFAAHGFDENGKVEFPPPGDQESIRVFGVFDGQGDVVDDLPPKAFPDLSAGEVFSVSPGEGGVIDLEHHADGGFVHGEGGKRLDGIGVAEGIGDAQGVDAGDGHDVAGPGGGDLDPIQSLGLQYLQRARGSFSTVAVDDGDGHVGARRAAPDASDADGADVRRIIQGADLHLEGTVRVGCGRRDMDRDGVEERRHVPFPRLDLESGIAMERGGIDDGEIQLLIGGAEAVEEIEGPVEHPMGPRAVPVDFVDDDDGPEPACECLLGNEAGLRHGTFYGIDQ